MIYKQSIFVACVTRFHPGEASAKDCMVVGLSSCHDHTVAMVMSIPEGSKGESFESVRTVIGGLVFSPGLYDHLNICVILIWVGFPRFSLS